MNRFWEDAVTGVGRTGWHYSLFLRLLQLVTPIYQVFSRRNLRLRKKRCSREWRSQVISVGNITVGGSGKTPIVIYLAERLIANGKRVAIVHSGYGRKSKLMQIIDYERGGEYSSDLIGDEPAMMAAKIPKAAFAIGRNKKEMTALVDVQLHPDVILIDDGYQRLDIEKNVDMAIVSDCLLDGMEKKENRYRLRLFPGGILREPLESLSRADAIFISKTGRVPASERGQTRLAELNGRTSIVEWTFSLAGVETGGEAVTLERLRTMRPFLFAGIGSYGRMLGMLKEAGIELAGDYGFADHCRYSPADLAVLEKRGAATDADCYLTTAKDMVKLSNRRFSKPLYCIKLSVMPSDETVVDRLIGV